MKSLKLIFGFIMGLCLTATMTSCDDDEDNGVSVPQEVLSAMPGTYVNSMEYGEATADSAMTVTLGTADMQFNLPVSNIIKDVVAAENLEQALNTYKADTCSVSYRISGYANNIVRMTADSCICNFEYQAGENTVKATADVAVTTASYNGEDNKLTLTLNIKNVKIDGKQVEDYTATTVTLPATEKQQDNQ